MEKALLAFVQRDFPLETKPFGIIAKESGCTEREIIVTVQSLMHRRVIRELGPVFNARRLGYISTLVAIKIERDRAVELSASMLNINEITHNYYRECDLNQWFTIIARDRGIMEDIIRWVEKFHGVSKVFDLPMEKMFKLNVVFGANSPYTPISNPARVPAPIGGDEQDIIRVLQNGLPIVEQPYHAIAAELDMSEAGLIERIRAWLDNGTIRRIGARVNHHRMGFAANALVVWEGDEVEKWGAAFAKMPQVSHCYIRRSYSDWPYRLYTMVHSVNENEMQGIIGVMRKTAPHAEMVVLKTLFELKKTSMRYFMEK